MLNPIITTTFILSNLINPIYDIYPSGENIVFEMKTKGIIVTGTYDININNEHYNPAIHSDIQIGDVILEVNNTPINSINSFIDTFDGQSQNSSLNLLISRKKDKINRILKIYTLNDQQKTGLYVKERVLGVGTLTFIDTDNNIYGALGHEVIDSDTNEIVLVNGGEIYKEDVIKISKGNNGNPGEKISSTNLNYKLGSISTNTEYGTFGTLNNYRTNYTSTEISSWKDVKLGKATILTSIKGNQVEEFEIEITSLKKQNEQNIKGITFKITDKRLLNETGGVYSGMSGSPILQNGKLIGAVTHVLVNDIKYGYGVYMEYMYEEAVESMNIM